MADIAQLGIAVDTSQTKLAARELDNLAAAGAKAEGSTKKLGSTSKQAMEQAAAATAKAQQTMERMLAAQERQERIMQQMSRQMDALTGAMQSNTAANNAAAKASENAAQAMGKQAAATQSAAQAMTEASQAMQGYASSTKAQAQASATATGGFTALTSSIGTLISAMAVRQVYEFGKAIFEASASAERLRTTLDFATGGKGASELAYVTQVANTLGLELQTTAKAYAQLAASARGTSLEGADAKAIFESVSKASSVMGLTAEQTAGALNALQQMISKGSVQSEELRGQLGERLPGAFQIAARAMGVTTQELGKMLEQGLVPASEFLPRFAAQLDLEVGGSAEKAADRLDAAANRMSNAWNALKTAIGDSGVSQAIATEMKAISQDITVASETMQTLKSDGNGAFTQLAAAAAQLSGRAGFGLLNTASNALNGTINMLTGSVLGLRTDLAYVPDVMKTNAQQAAIMGDEVEAAKNKLARLQELDKNPANGNYYKTAIAQTQGLIASLNEAIGKKEQLARGGASADVYSPNSVQKQIQDSIDARQKERDSALEAFVTKRENMSKEQAMRKAIADAEKSHAEMMKKYDGDEAAQAKIRLSLESAIANVREKNKPAKEAVAVDAGENEVASIRARVKAVQANIAALQEYGAAAEKQTDGDRMVLKIQEELAGGIKGVARANKEKALAAAESLASAQKEEQAIKSQIELQKKQEEEYRKTIQAMSDVAEKTEQQAIGIEAQNEAYGRSKTAIEQQVLASKKLQLQRLEELGLTGDYTKALGLQIAAQERLVDALAASDYKKMSEHTDKLLSNANAQAALYADELELTGLTAVERAKVVAQRQVELKYAKEIDEVNRSNLSTDEKQAQLRKIAEAQQIESSAAVNKVIQDDFARTSEQINNSLTDALLNAFEGGKNAAQGVKEAIVKMFNDMVLRPVISAIVAPVSGMLTTGAQAATSAIGGSGFGGSMVSGLAGNVGAFGGAVQGFGTAALAATQSMIGMTGTVAQMSTSLAAAGHTAAAGMQSGISAFQAIPGWGWALAGIGLLAGMMDFGGEQRFGGGYQLNGNKEVKYTAGPGGGQINQEAQEAVVNETYKSVNSILKSLGSTLEVIDFYAGLETSGKGKGGTFAGGKLSSGVEFGKKWQAGMYSQDLSAEEAVKQFAEQMKIVTVEALKAATDIPQYLQAELAKVDVTKLTGETAGLVLEEVNRMFTTFSTVKAAFEILNKPMFDTTTAGYELTESFVNLFGGLENFKSATASYYENFYSESERFNNAQQQLTQTLTEAGLAVPTTREAYRQLVEAQDLTTEAGRKNYAVLLKNAGAFAELTPAAEAANRQIAGINKLFHGLSIDGKLVETKFTKETEDIFDSLGVSVQEYSSSIGNVISGILTGTTKAEDAGAALANAAVGGINNAIAQAASDAIAAQFVNAVITPILANIQSGRAALEGVDVEGAIAKANQDALDVKTVLNTIGKELGVGIEGMAASIVDASNNAGVQIANASKFAGVQTPGYVTGVAGGTGAGTVTPSLFAGVQGGGGLTLEPAVSAVSSLVTETLDSNKKVSELLQKLLNPEKEYANRYLALADQLLQKQSEFGVQTIKDTLASMRPIIDSNNEIMSTLTPLFNDFSESIYSWIVKASQTGYSEDYTQVSFNTDALMALSKQIASTLNRDVTEVYNYFTETVQGLAETGNLDKLGKYFDILLGLPDVTELDFTEKTNQLLELEKQLREWYIAQARVIAVEDMASLAEEARDAKAQTATLKRTGGLEDPVTKLKEQFAEKMQAIDEGIGKALLEEVDRLKAQKPVSDGDIEDVVKTTALSGMKPFDQLQWQLRYYKQQLSQATAPEDIANLNKGIADIEKQITDAIVAATDPAKQQELLDEIAKYKGGVTEWFKAQAELLSTEMLVDINKQITALEAEEKGPLTTIKDAIQKYADDFEALGTMTDDVQARLDKMEGLQLEKARNALYDQLLTPEEVTANAKAKLKTDFGDIISTALGETMMGSIESQMMGGGVPQGSEALITLLQGVGEEMPTTTAGFRALIDSIDTSTTSGQNLRDSLLELVPGFVSLQGAADGATDALTPLEEVEKAFGALERAINAEKEALRTAFDARMEVLQKELAIAQERAGIENQAIKLLGRSKELRAAELEAMDASNRGLQQRIWAVEDASENVDKALSTLQRSVAAQKASVSESAQSQIDAINAGAEARQKAVDDAQKSVQDLTGIFEEITNAVKTLRGNAQDEAMRMEQARAYISMALSVAQAGGAVDQKRLSEAMATVTSDTAETYAAGADYRFAQARQAAELQKLADVTGGQKDVAQATLDAALSANEAAQDQIKAITEARDSQLKALDNQLKTAQDAVSVMRGVDLSVLGVGDAVTALDTAMAAYEVERARLGAEQLFTGQIQVTLLEKQIEQEQANFDAQIEALDSQLEIAQSQLDALRGVDNSVQSLAAAMSAFASAQAAAAAAAQAAAATPASGGAITYDGPQGPGLYVNGGLTGGVRPKPVPSYDIGTNYVPRDTLAMVHEGEAIVPKAFNPSAFGRAKSDDGQLASLVVSLTAEVQRLQGIVQAGNAEQRRTADAVNGRPEAPMLVETV